MHWTAQYSSHGRMGALVNPFVDPISKQPESKHTPVRIKAYLPVWQGFILSRDELELVKSDYWVKIKGEQFYRYELAGETLPENWPDWARKNVCDTGNTESQWQEYQDPAKGNYRAAQFVDNQLQSIIFIAGASHLPEAVGMQEVEQRREPLPERSWLASLFVKTELDKSERMALLTGSPPLGVNNVGAIVCACFNVGEQTIKTAIKEQRLMTHQEVGRCLKAGTNCGSCVPEIKALLSL
jgi:assimilatory nitrate reductase catalytic subunit